MNYQEKPFNQNSKHFILTSQNNFDFLKQVKRNSGSKLSSKVWQNVKPKSLSNNAASNPTYNKLLSKLETLNIQQNYQSNQVLTSPREIFNLQSIDANDLSILQNEQTKEQDRLMEITHRSVSQLNPNTARYFSPSSIPIQQNKDKLQMLVYIQKSTKRRVRNRRKSRYPDQDKDNQKRKSSLRKNQDQGIETAEQKSEEMNTLSEYDSTQNQVNVPSIMYLDKHKEKQIAPQTQIYFNEAEVLNAIQQKMQKNEGKKLQNLSPPKILKKLEKTKHQKKFSLPICLKETGYFSPKEKRDNLNYKITCGGGFTSNNKLHEKSHPKCFASTIVKGKLQALLKQQDPPVIENLNRRENEQNMKLFLQTKELIKKIKSKTMRQQEINRNSNQQFSKSKQEQPSKLKQKINSFYTLSKVSKLNQDQFQFNPSVQGNFVVLYKTKKNAVENYYAFEPTESQDQSCEEIKEQKLNELFLTNENQSEMKKENQTPFTKNLKDQNSKLKKKTKQYQYIGEKLKLQKQQNQQPNQQENYQQTQLNEGQNHKNRVAIRNLDHLNQKQIDCILEEPLDKISQSFEQNKMKSKYQIDQKSKKLQSYEKINKQIMQQYQNLNAQSILNDIKINSYVQTIIFQLIQDNSQKQSHYIIINQNIPFIFVRRLKKNIQSQLRLTKQRFNRSYKKYRSKIIEYQSPFTNYFFHTCFILTIIQI